VISNVHFDLKQVLKEAADVEKGEGKPESGEGLNEEGITVPVPQTNSISPANSPGDESIRLGVHLPPLSASPQPSKTINAPVRSTR